MKYVLVVDDDNITLMMVSHALTDTYRVATATSGAEAIKLLDTEIPDLILPQETTLHLLIQTIILHLICMKKLLIFFRI